MGIVHKNKKRPHPNPGADGAVHRGGQGCCSPPSQARIRSAELGAERSLLGKSKKNPTRAGDWEIKSRADIQSGCRKWFKLKQAGGSKQGRTLSDDGHVGSLLLHAGKPLKSARSNASRAILAGCLSQAQERKSCTELRY